ncbi:hypothetical protein CSUI_007962 [Cystoisospora suis]|uniref:Transmembrane protein n=1 Tax=Cystoisospora suis TaxID=483139 RepID=A0A2C6JRP9_9APIC|nr:hypothetical protein CSUI_007962 [Cystoisospora suis]
MVPTTIVRFKCSSVLQGCSCWLLLSSLESFYHSTPFDEAAVPGRRGRTAGPTGGNEAYFWTSTGLPSFLLSSAASQIPSVLQEQRLPTAYDDSRSPDAPSMAGGDEHGHREEGDESSLLEDSVAAASDSDAWGRQVGDSVASETTESYLGEEGEGFLLSASPLSKSHSPERRSRNHKRESKMRISKILMSVLTATTLLAALLVYRKSKQPREDPSGRKSSFSTWIVESGMSEKRRVGAIVLAGVIVIVAALLTIGFAGTEGPDVRAEGQITSSEAEGAPAPSDSSVSSTRQLVEIEKRVREVVSDAPMRAVAVAFAVLTLPFLVMRPSQVRDQTEDVGEADLKQRNGEAESADEGKRQEVFEEADGGETIAKGQEGATSGADAGVVEGEKEKETEAKGEEVDEGGVAEERRERPQMEAGRESYEAKTIEGEAKTQADQADMLKNPDVLSKTQGEEDPRTDKALGQEAQKALSSFVPDEVPSVFDYGPVFQAITNDIAAQAKSEKRM